MPSTVSDVQVFVKFRDQCVFAGEDLHCTITFKNVAEAHEPLTPSLSHGTSTLRQAKRNSISQLAAARSNAEAGPRMPNVRTPSSGYFATQDPGRRGNHQASYSISNPPTPQIGTVRSSGVNESSSIVTAGEQKHQRSVSIMSLNSPVLPDNGASRGPSKQLLGHRRSSTMQIPDMGRRPSPTDRLASDARAGLRNNGRRSPLSASHSPSAASGDHTPEFKFPPENTTTVHEPSSRPKPSPDRGRVRMASHQRVASMATTARDSIDMQSIGHGSNHSDETLMSEQAMSLVSERPQAHAPRSRMPSEMIRQHYKMDSLPGHAPPPPRKPETVTLLMGYAQVGATFTLDASLVDQTPFEEVKKKGYLGGQAGGGVVGVNKKKPARPTSGLFSGFNFASLGESLESIMMGSVSATTSTSSSMKEMKAVTNSRAIPLLSTPQSLLFVDVKLHPGEQKRYHFSYKLPKGLPASYRGKAIKIIYNLTIGVQGAANSKEVRQINVPFRIFPAVDSDGEVLGHDLMQPHVILKDLATTKQIDDSREEEYDKINNGSSKMTLEDVNRNTAQFLNFVDALLDRNKRRQSSTGSMMEMMQSSQNQGGRTGGSAGGPSSQRFQSPAVQAINRAIMMSNQVIGEDEVNSTSPNRFEIARGGQRIAVVTLDRPLHRLGETVTVVIDFSNSQVACSSLRATLETMEKVDAGLAVRSAATIARVTRKVYASRAENVLFAKRIVFTPNIPVLVSPTFVTSGVGLEWCIKLEFGTVKQVTESNTEIEMEESEKNLGEDEDNGAANRKQAKQISAPLLEEIFTDEKGMLEVAVETLDCDHFEVVIPITVYGDVMLDGTTGAVEEEEVIGIPI